MKKILILASALVLTLTLCLPLFTFGVSAAVTPEFSVGVSKTTVHPKQTITVSVNVRNLDDCVNGIATIQAALVYDSTKLTIDDDTGIVPNSMITDADMTVNVFHRESNPNLIEMWVTPKSTEAVSRMLTNVFTCTFTVNEDVPEGTELEFSLGDDPYLFVINAWDADKTEPFEVEFLLGDAANVTVGKLLSENADLRELSVEGYELNRTFSSTRLSYAIAVPNDVTSVNVDYVTDSEFATAKLAGNTRLTVGTNTVKVTVTAEDGVSKKTYSIVVTRQPAETESSEPPVDTSSDVPSEPGSDTSSDLPSDTSGNESSSDITGETSVPASDTSESPLQSQIEFYKDENTLLRDREISIILVFTVVTGLLLTALIIVSVNYKKDIK